jgi:hypothetical protein
MRKKRKEKKKKIKGKEECLEGPAEAEAQRGELGWARAEVLEGSRTDLNINLGQKDQRERQKRRKRRKIRKAKVPWGAGCG